ncbi:MAG: lipid-A-disaccharide synthase [Nonlabens sp.]|jgi:lipid-A-disaccharide synthase
MKYYLISGEASGDLHGSNLVHALLQKDPNAEICGWGGDLMQEAGAQILKHYRDLAFMGFSEVVMNLPTIFNNFRLCKKQILDFQPDVLVLIDYPGFNLRMAKWAKKKGIRVSYYISPQIWAWHSSRAKQIKANIDQMLVILPFEKAFYQQYNYKVNFVGHPLLDVVNTFKPTADFKNRHGLSDKKIIALLPGSRKQEIKTALSIMLKMIPQFPDHQFVVAGAPSIPKEYYQNIFQQNAAQNEQEIKLIQNETYSLLILSTAALVTSGTATLEAALFDIPQVVCYKGSPISYQIAKRVIQVEYISLVNLILEKPLLAELIQEHFNPTDLAKALAEILKPEKQKELKEEYRKLRKELGDSGASERAAKLIIEGL